MQKYLLLLFLSLCSYLNLAQPPVDYLNELRRKAGLIELKQDQRLSNAATMHCRYMNQVHKLTHKEHHINKFFTGKYPDQRAVQAGLHCRYVAENLTFNQSDAISAINDLFATVYHRLSLLSPSMDIVGFGSWGKYYGLLLSNSYLDSVCNAYEDNPDLISFVYVSVCDMIQKKLPLMDFLTSLEKVRQRNKSVIVYPYPGQENVPVSFSDEKPSPLRRCFIAGYPITVEFNPYYNPLLPTRVVIKLRDSRGKLVPARLLKAANDPNHKLSPYQYALIPRKVLMPGELYHVYLSYNQGRMKRKKSWSFETVSYPSLYIVNGQKTLYVPSPAEFYVMIVPKTCRDTVFNDLQVKYSADYFKVDYVNSLFLKIDIGGRTDQFAQLQMNNGYSLHIIIL